MGICIIYYGFTQISGKYLNWDDKAISSPVDRYTEAAVMQYGNPDIYEKTASFLPEADSLQLSKSTFADICLFGGIFAIMTGFLGFASICWRKPYFTCPFVYLSFSVGFLLVVAGTISLQYGKNSKFIFNELCFEFEQETSDFRQRYSENIDVHMCTDYCPCWSGHSKVKTSIDADHSNLLDNPYLVDTYRNKALWQGYMGIDEKYLNMFNRTRQQLPRDIEVNGKTQTLNELVWKDFKFDQDGNYISFSSYKECLDNVLVPQRIVNQTEDSIEFFKRDGVFTYLGQLERDYQCSSLCQPNLFYIGRDLNEGKPTKECAQAISDSWGNSKSFQDYGKIGGGISIALGIIMMLALFCSIPLCRGFGHHADKGSKYKYKDQYV